MSHFIVQTTGLTKYYGRQLSVDNLALKVPAGSIYGLLGPNGAGKSTTLKLLTGLIRPDNGKIQVFGEPWQRHHLQRIGALIEEPALYGNLTAEENLLIHTTIMGLPKTEIDRVLNLVNLKGTEDKLVSRFSTGMKQRLGIAIALLGKPELLILDEPTNGLDPLGIQEFRRLVKSFPKMGITVILSSHILTEVAQVVDHVGIISEGRLRYQGAIGNDTELERLFIQVVRGQEQ
ncbi:MAG: lantibiotic protection ABC transporter ATP-binding protein [Firmicutes bacterium]|nr:lantibiotic protection ABC transporter ATP-binding protein [Bacillota bacterium]